MATHNEIGAEELAAYVAGEGDAGARAAVEHWAAASPEHAAELARWQQLWALSADAGPDAATDVAWEKLSKRIDAAEPATVRGLFPKRWLAAAAVLVGLGFFLWLRGGAAEEHYLATAAPLNLKLSDGSEVSVSRGGELRVDFGKERITSLSGEAYFSVRPDAERPFSVRTEGLSVTVLGTAFTVSAYDTADHVSVRVREGRVQVRTADTSVVLVAGERIRFDRRRSQLERAAAPPMEAWGDRVLQFEKAPLGRVVERLAELHEVRIDLADRAAATCLLTATFEDEPVETVLRVIAETFGLTMERTGPKAFVLRGHGC